MREPNWTTLLHIEELGDALTVRAKRHHPLSRTETWFDVEIRVSASPFAGTVTTIFTLGDLQQWRHDLDALGQSSGLVALGGGRAALLRFDVTESAGELYLDIHLTASEDDAVPRIEFSLALGSGDFGSTVAALDQLVASLDGQPA